MAVPALSVGAAAATTPTATTTTVPVTTSTTVPPSTTVSAAAPATSPVTTSTVAPTTTVVDVLAGVNWIQSAYPSPCTDATVQIVGGSAMQGDHRAVLDDVVPIDPAAGSALAFLSCRDSNGSVVESSAVLLRVRRPTIASIAERQLGAGARVVAADPPTFTVESPAQRATLTASAGGLTVTPLEQAAAFDETASASAAVGRDAQLVRRSVPRAALCYPWNNVWLSDDGEPDPPAPLSEPSAELQTIRLALIHLTGRWIEPTDHMNAEMAAVVTAYQESRGLTVDGSIGNETTRALRADLGCPDVGGFTMVPPTGLGPRGFSSVTALVATLDRYAMRGRSGYASIDQLLRDSHWDGRNAMFLGCYRWQAPSTGLSCSWSGATPLQLVGLVDDPAQPGLGTFSILYARSTAV
jgi:peptidoglycan hydrolase-like protein with peptidoglycan-binding domain